MEVSFGLLPVVVVQMASLIVVVIVELVVVVVREETRLDVITLVDGERRTPRSQHHHQPLIKTNHYMMKSHRVIYWKVQWG